VIPIVLAPLTRSLAVLLVALSGSAVPRPEPASAPHRAELAAEVLVFDCNENGVEDSVDIAIGTSGDSNENGIPDECEARAK
jgi:hypothetical protein